MLAFLWSFVQRAFGWARRLWGLLSPQSTRVEVALIVQPASSTPEYIDAGELARRLSISRGTVRNLAQQGLIPEIVVSPRTRRYDWAAVQEALRRRPPT